MAKGKIEYSRDLVKEIRDLVKRLDVVFNTVITGSGLAQQTTLQQVENNTDQVETLLNQVVTNTSSTYSLDAGASDASTLRVVLEDLTRNLISQIKSDIDLYGEYKNWTKIPGKSVEYTWINGTTPGKRLVQTAVYKTGIVTEFTQTFAYNANDEIISITAS